MKQFAARANSRISDDDANLIGLEIRRLTEDAKTKDSAQKGITAEDLVEAAKDPSSTIHSFFEWDDSVAGRQWRVQQARVLMGSIVPIHFNGDKVEVRSFNAIKILTPQQAASTMKVAAKQRQYIELKAMETDDELKVQISDQFLREVRNLLKRYDRYASVWPDFRSHHQAVAVAIGLKPAKKPVGLARAV